MNGNEKMEEVREELMKWIFSQISPSKQKILVTVLAGMAFMEEHDPKELPEEDVPVLIRYNWESREYKQSVIGGTAIARWYADGGWLMEEGDKEGFEVLKWRRLPGWQDLIEEEG